MGLRLVTAATVEPVTMAEARAHLRVDTNDEDALIAGYIVAARKAVETQTGPLCTQTWDYTIGRTWPMVGVHYGIRLPYAPVQSVTSVSYVDENGATQTLSSALYQSDLSAPIPTIWKAYGALWPSVRDQPAAITVRFVAGYGTTADVPDPIRQAILLMVGQFYEHRENVVLNQVPHQIPMGVDALISPYSLSARSW